MNIRKLHKLSKAIKTDTLGSRIDQNQIKNLLTLNSNFNNSSAQD